MLFLVGDLVTLGCCEISLFFYLILLRGNCPVLFLKLNVGLFLDLIAPVDIIAKEAYKYKREYNKIENKLLLFKRCKLKFNLILLLSDLVKLFINARHLKADFFLLACKSILLDLNFRLLLQDHFFL